MGKNPAAGGTGGLAAAKRRFDHWRQHRQRRGQIPAELWKLAVEAAVVHGVHDTARHLRLNAATLKEQMQRLADNPAVDEAPRFVELPWLGTPCTPECILEAEDPTGRKLRIQLKGQATAQAGSLGRMLWRDEE